MRRLHWLELLADKFSATASPERREREINRVDALTVLVLKIEHLTGKALTGNSLNATKFLEE